MLVKHTDGQIIDYSMIIQLPGYGDVEAVKSSVFKTAFSGDSPAELIMELSDGTELWTTDFVAEDKYLEEFHILDENVIKRLTDIARSVSKPALGMVDAFKVWLCHNECAEHWTIGVDFVDESREDICFLDNDGCICLTCSKVYFIPAAKGKAEE